MREGGCAQLTSTKDKSLKGSRIAVDDVNVNVRGLTAVVSCAEKVVRGGVGVFFRVGSHTGCKGKSALVKMTQARSPALSGISWPLLSEPSGLSRARPVHSSGPENVHFKRQGEGVMITARTNNIQCKHHL